MVNWIGIAEYANSILTYHLDRKMLSAKYSCKLCRVRTFQPLSPRSKTSLTSFKNASELNLALPPA